MVTDSDIKLRDNFKIKNTLEVPLGVVNFADLKQLLFKCFIELKAEYLGYLPISFKSLNDNEIHRIKTLAGNIENPKYQKRLKLYYFLFSLYSVDNVNLLEYRDAYMNNVLPFIESIHPKIFNLIMNELFKLGSRVVEAIKLVERYTFEPDSKWLWYSLKNSSLTSPEVTGINGTEKLGYNICQLLWIYFNQKEDEKQDFEKMWSCAKLIASVINPKVVQKLNSHEENKKIEEKNRREKIVLGETYKPKFKIQSREELVEELEKQMLGEKDEHDLYIENHMKKVKYESYKNQEKVIEKQKELKEQKKNLLIDYDDKEIFKHFEELRKKQEEEKDQLQKEKENLVKSFDENLKSSHLNAHYAAQQLTDEDIYKIEQELDKKNKLEGLINSEEIIEKFTPKKPIDPSIYLKKYRKD